MSTGQPSGRGRLVVVTGLSGAGRTTALKALEDMGYEAVDNLPLSLLSALVAPQSLPGDWAVGVDVRTRDFAVPALAEALDRLAGEQPLDLRLVFLDCEDELLVRRYTETRRRHPLAIERPVADGVRLERERLSPLRDRADLVIDTSALAPADLKRLLQGNFARDAEPGINIFVTSFSYRHGLPRDADLVLDVRFLRNPHYVAALRPLSGREAEVGAFIEQDADFARLFDQYCLWIDELLPRYEREGKSYLTIAIGCTGGRHRSVFVAERLAAWFSSKGRRVGLAHRDLDRPRDTLRGSAADAPAPPLKDIA